MQYNQADADGDLNMARRIQENPKDHKYPDLPEYREGHETDQGNEGSDGENDLEENNDSRRFFTATAILMHENLRVALLMGTCSDPVPLSARFQRSGGLYDVPNVKYQLGLDYSKAELKRACREFLFIG